MELPTYTNIWRIEKRLYKLYDFRLPMPLPVGQIAVFAAIIVPYVVALTILGLPFSHSLVWLYLLPPGALTWLATRPVLESKRLPELAGSQLRYLGEPRTWCRMAPLSEPDVITVSGPVWRRAGACADPEAASAAEPTAAARAAVPDEIPEAWRVTVAARARPAARTRPAPASMAAGRAAGPRAEPEQRAVARVAAVPAAPGRAAAVVRLAGSPPRPEPAVAAAAPPEAGTTAASAPPTAAGAAEESARPAMPPAAPAAGMTAASAPPTAAGAADGPARPAIPGAARSVPRATGNARPDPMAQPVKPAGTMPGRAAAEVRAAPPQRAAGRTPVRIVGDPDVVGAPQPVERRLAGPAHGSGGLVDDRVLLVPGGYRPGAPDRRQRDRARAQQPLAGPCRVVVLGCTVGAGQTTTTLMTGEVLASLRADPVAVLDLNPGSRSLAAMALARPALSQAATLARSRLEVLSRADEPAGTEGAGAGDRGVDPRQPAAGSPGGDAPAGDSDLGRMFQLASARYPLVLADPSAGCLPRLLAVTDQLVLVAPASAAAARGIGMTVDWLESHGGSRLARSAVVVMNGVSSVSADAVNRAEQVARGWCRAIVRVPWDDQIKRSGPAPDRQPGQTRGSPPAAAWTGLVSPGAVSAYTALAGVLVTSLAAAGPTPPPGSRS